MVDNTNNPDEPQLKTVEAFYNYAKPGGGHPNDKYANVFVDCAICKGEEWFVVIKEHCKSVVKCSENSDESYEIDWTEDYMKFR
jgi:hypothetical protein